jgi:hypothetical protein
MLTNVCILQQVHNARLLHIDPTNWLRVMLEFEYPIISQFHGDHAHVVGCSTNDFLMHQFQKSGLLPGQSGTRTPSSTIKTRGTKWSSATRAAGSG